MLLTQLPAPVASDIAASAEPIAPTHAPPPARMPDPPVRNQGRTGWIVAALSVVAALVFAGLWMTTRNNLDKVTSERDALVASAAAAQAEADALPDVFAIIDKHVGDEATTYVTGDETYASVSVFGDTGGLIDALEELGFSDGIGARIGNTRALDGTLTASGDKVTATWTYHPDDGLSLVVQREE